MRRRRSSIDHGPRRLSAILAVDGSVWLADGVDGRAVARAHAGLDVEAIARELVAAVGTDFEVSHVHAPPWGEWPAWSEALRAALYRASGRETPRRSAEAPIRRIDVG